MWHATYTQGIWGNSKLLVVGNQIVNLTPGHSFGHNLCFVSKWSDELILDIYVPRSFQWYKEIFNSMNFDPYNSPLKIWKSIGTLTPKMGVHLWVWGFIPSHSLALLGVWNVTHGIHSWPAPLQALVLVTSPRLRLQHMLWILAFLLAITCVLSSQMDHASLF
jgi:hypothetical protein